MGKLEIRALRNTASFLEKLEKIVVGAIKNPSEILQKDFLFCFF